MRNKREIAMLIMAIIFCIINIVMIVVKSNKKYVVNTEQCTQVGGYFPTGEERFILVDESIQTIGNSKYLCRVFADKYMLTMYLWMSEQDINGKFTNASMTQIFYEEGSPMIYDISSDIYNEYEKANP